MHSSHSQRSWVLRGASLLGGALLALSATLTQAITINVVKPDGTAIDVPFRWVLQEDQTWNVAPGVTGTTAPGSGGVNNTLSLQFHRSYMPVVESSQTANTTGTATSPAVLDPAKRYFISVLPNANGAGEPVFQMSGAPIRPNANGSMPSSIRVVVTPTPITTAQISVLVYNDRNPINNIPDSLGGQEYGLCGWDIHLYDAGGTYGASGGRFGYDAFGNPLGTTYDTNGDVIDLGSLELKTDANGVFRVKNLAGAKYTVYALPPAVMPPQSQCPRYYSQNGNPPLTPWPGPGQSWMQTHTIEGTQGIDGWIKPNEPSYFSEFGPPGHHVFIGFVPTFSATGGAGNNITASGQVVNVHMSRPPNFTFHNGTPMTECRIGLNESASTGVGNGIGVYAGKCDSNGNFSIPGLKPNTRYQLAVWDKAQGTVFGKYDFVTTTAAVNLGKVPVFNWFGKLAGKVCHDPSGAGGCTPTSTGIPGQAVNIRFRDGSIYQSVATDNDGNYEFPEVFPFFNWMVAEVDYLRYEATGVTTLADAGGPLPTSPVWPNRGQTTPYGAPEVTEGEVILQGMQLFLGQTNIMDWGKRAYVGTSNGGISGKINYSSTRAESDPRYATAENNEPGIPGVTVRLYNASPANPKVAVGAAIATATSDSWDAATPSDCINPQVYTPPGGTATDCYDGLRNFNQTKGAVYDGGYAFTGLSPGNYVVEVVPPTGYEVQKEEDKNVDFGDSLVVSTLALPPECVGTRATPVPLELDLFPGVAIPPEYRVAPGGGPRPLCDRKAVTLNPGLNAAMDFHLFTKTPVAGHIVGMILDDLANEFDPHAPNFGEKFAPPFMPVSLRDHTGREFSRVYSDRFGNYNALVPSTFAFNVPMPSGVSPNMVQACLNAPYMPVKNPDGSDALDPINGKPLLQPDPHHNKSYSQFCYTFQYLPGKTTYLDTPVLPIAAFAGPQQFSLDCANPDVVPGIRSVNGSTNVGPWVSASGQTLTIYSMGSTQVLNPLWDSNNPGANVARTIPRDYGFGAHNAATSRVSINGVDVPVTAANWSNDAINITVPAGATSGTLLVTRGNGNVTPRGVTVHIGGATPTKVSAGGSIQAAINAATEGALITVEPGLYEETVIVDKRIRLQGYGAGGTLINAVTQPTEALQAWRRAICERVTAAGGGSFLLPGQALPVSLDACLTGDTADNAPLLFGDGETPGFFVMIKSNGAANPQPRPTAGSPLQIDGFTISGADKGGGVNVNGFAAGLEVSNNAISGNQGIVAGGIRIGPAALTTEVLNPDGTNQVLPVGSRNVDVKIHHNEIVQNGNTAGDVGGGGGGIGMFYGATNYNVSKNLVCGNLSTGNGGGMAHFGVSDNGVIDGNKFLWNASFYQATSVQGGGVSIAGRASLVAAGLSTGSGNVRISNNQILGNMAGAGDGGGISLLGTNGNELTPLINVTGYRIDIFNNEIVNNAAGMAGGGIALQDASNVRIWNNTIAQNDSTATAARAFSVNLAGGISTGNLLASSTAQRGAGIASYRHSPAFLVRRLLTQPVQTLLNPFSDPDLRNNVLWQNRKFHFAFTAYGNAGCTVNVNNTCYGLINDGFDDLGVVDSPVLAGQPTQRLHPASSVLTTLIPYGALLSYNGLLNPPGFANNNTAANPLFVASFFNGPRDSIVLQVEQSVLPIPAVAAAFDEGGNWIDLRYGPLTLRNPATLALYRDFNVPLATSSARAQIARGQILNTQPDAALLATDKDGATRNAVSVPLFGNRWPVGAYQPR